MCDNDVAELVRVAQAALATVGDRSGKILYSAARTIRPCPLYTLGLNPGGHPDSLQSSHYSISDALLRLPDKCSNDYVDEVWEGAKAPGTRPIQKRMRWLCARLGQPIEEVCAANLIFLRSRDSAGSGFPETADLCWPVHEAILRIVRPRLILTHGAEVYKYILKRMGGHAAGSEILASGHGTWLCRRTHLEFEGRPVHLAQVPHLSRYEPGRNPELIRWLSASLQTD